MSRWSAQASSSDVHRLRIESFGHAREVRPHAVEPDRVGIDQKERRFAELRQRLGDAAAGAEQFAALVGDHDVWPLPRREMTLQNIGEMVHVDDGAFHAGIGQTVERIIDQRLAADFHQRLWDVAVIGPHARAQIRPPARSRGSASWCPPDEPHVPPTHFIISAHWFFGGRLAAYQALRGARSGCASDRCK